MKIYAFAAVCTCSGLAFKPQGLQLKCRQTVMRAPPGRQTYKETEVKVCSESAEPDKEEDVVSKTSH